MSSRPPPSYPPFWEKAIPIFLALIGLAMLLMLGFALTVLLGYFR